ncbi:MAG: hypothetical protein HYY30_14000 [Chloroflexi bacterium]|nr:hypothetical protein [Chloroflexota bacterium]
MIDGRMALTRVARLIVFACAALALVGATAACSLAPAKETANKTETIAEKEGVRSGTETTQVAGAANTAATSGCVSCHTSKEKVKETADPPEPVVKSAEQAGEG